MNRTRRTLAGWLPVVEYCAEEVRRQYHWSKDAGHAARCVGYMVNAWSWALTETGRVTPEFIEKIGSIVEPQENIWGFREYDVRVAQSIKSPWANVPRLIEILCAGPLQDDDPAEFYHQFEEVHPFGDGNGRTGKILYNYLKGTMLAPEFPPSFWGDVVNP